MKPMNESAIRTGIMQAMIKCTPIKIKHKESASFDPYFGDIIEINTDTFALDHGHEDVEIIRFDEIDNLINL